MTGIHGVSVFARRSFKISVKVWTLLCAVGVITSVTAEDSSDCGDPLFLSPYIKANLLPEARRASKVVSFLPTEWQITSHSGYVTVKEGSNLFFWLFPSLKDPDVAPLVLWLGGSPGAASSVQPFFRNGPYVVDDKSRSGPQLIPAFYHWSEIMHVLHIDSPVGTGFSFNKNSSAFAGSSDDVVGELYSAISQIFQIFPEYQSREFFIVGESYSAKYASLLAYKISTAPRAAVNINLKGVAIGNGWLGPANMINHSDVLFDVGLIDSNEKSNFEELENSIAFLIKNESYSDAFDLLRTYVPLVQNITGFRYFGNYLRWENDADHDYVVKVTEYLNQTETRRRLHVGSQPFTAFNDDVFDHLKIDLLRPIAPAEFGAVLDNYRVLLFSGQLDLTCAYRRTTEILQEIRWDGSEMYKKAPRRKWLVEGELAGYVKSAGKFTEILVRNAGIRVAEDRPLWAWDLIKKFVKNIPFA